MIGLGTGGHNNGTLMVYALQKLGLRHIDTAQVYGNEAVIGAVVRAAGIRREDLHITTKIANWPGAGYDYQKTTDSFHHSLETLLKLDYVDLLMLHLPFDMSNRAAQWRAVLDLHSAGLAKAVGVSNFSPRSIESLGKHGLALPMVNQFEVNPWCLHEEVVSYCHAKGIVVEAYGSLGNISRHSQPALQAIARRHDKPVTAILLRWLLQRGIVPITGTDSEAHLRSNVDMAGLELSAAEMDVISTLNQGQPSNCVAGASGSPWLRIP